MKIAYPTLFFRGFDSRLVHYLQCTHEVSALSTQALTDGVRKRLAQIIFLDLSYE
nr:MAG TPA: hypothetical protein [Caudoviricetes sp.]